MIYTETYNMLNNIDIDNVSKYLSTKLMNYIAHSNDIIIIGSYDKCNYNSNCINISDIDINIKEDTLITIWNQYDIELLGNSIIEQLENKTQCNTQLICIFSNDCLVTCTKTIFGYLTVDIKLNLMVLNGYTQPINKPQKSNEPKPISPFN